jgi:hypothetical protein
MKVEDALDSAHVFIRGHIDKNHEEGGHHEDDA